MNWDQRMIRLLIYRIIGVRQRFNLSLPTLSIQGSLSQGVFISSENHHNCYLCSKLLGFVHRFGGLPKVLSFLSFQGVLPMRTKKRRLWAFLEPCIAVLVAAVGIPLAMESSIINLSGPMLCLLVVSLTAVIATRHRWLPNRG